MIYYLNWYNGKSKYTRSKNPAASTKILYTAKAIKESGNDVSILSCAHAGTDSGKFFCKKEIVDDEGINVIYAPCIASEIVLLRKIGSFLKRIWVFLFLLKNLKDKDFVLVYHSMFFVSTLKLIKKIKKNIAIEVNEIYADVNEKDNTKEVEFLKSFDRYIFCTEQLNEKINPSNKPYCVCLGSYSSPIKAEKRLFDDGKIHCVHAGSFDMAKGGAKNAIEAAQFLNDKYHLHIIGFGSEHDTNILKEMIEETSKKTSATISYDGLYLGRDYEVFLQSCEIGLNTQNLKGSFGNTSFPSKILTYMANGLQVVAPKVGVIENSPISDEVYFYEEQTPESIAKTILSIDLKKHNSQNKIRTLDENFVKEVRVIFE